MMRNNLNVYWFIRVSSTINNKKENLVCINCGHFHSVFHWFGHKHIFSMELDYQSILIKVYSFALYFFITEKMI